MLNYNRRLIGNKYREKYENTGKYSARHFQVLSSPFGEVGFANRYNQLKKVGAVETFQNELEDFKVDERFVSFRSPRKCLALQIFPANPFSVSQLLGLDLNRSPTARAQAVDVAHLRPTTRASAP